MGITLQYCPCNAFAIALTRGFLLMSKNKLIFFQKIRFVYRSRNLGHVKVPRRKIKSTLIVLYHSSAE